MTIISFSCTMPCLYRIMSQKHAPGRGVFFACFFTKNIQKHLEFQAGLYRSLLYCLHLLCTCFVAVFLLNCTKISIIIHVIVA